MDFKNLIIALLAAALGVATLEATNVIDLLNNNGNDTSAINVDYLPLPTVQQWQNQFGQKITSTGNRHGYYFEIDQILGMIADAQRNKKAGDTLHGIIVYPYFDNTKDLNLYMGINPDKYIGSKFWCPKNCDTWITPTAN